MRDYGEWGDLDWEIAASPPPEFVRLIDSLAPRKRVVEFGVGSGRMMFPLLEAGFDVLGVDVSPTMLGILTARCSPHRVMLRCLDVTLERPWMLKLMLS